MRVDHDFPVNQFIAKPPAGGRFDGIAATVRIPMHEMGMQNAHVRLMHLRNQAMGLEPDFCVNPMWASGVKDSPEEMARGVRGA